MHLKQILGKLLIPFISILCFLSPVGSAGDFLCPEPYSSQTETREIVTSVTNESTEQRTTEITQIAESSKTTSTKSSEQNIKTTTETQTKRNTTTAAKTSKKQYLKTYSDESLSINIEKRWYKKAWCYIAHITMTDYTRFTSVCANGKYNNGKQTVREAAKQNNAIFAVNGCYSASEVNNAVVRHSVVYNRGNDPCYNPVFYNNRTGILGNATTLGVENKTYNEAVGEKLISDSFCFGPEFDMVGETNANEETGGRAQRTFIGTNGRPGDMYIVVSDGRMCDGESEGLTYQECADLLKELGCSYGAPLDGGGSSTMVFKGEVLNCVKTERAVVDFVIIK